jgi:hypothetical protein
MPEFNLDLSLLRELTAEAPGRGDQAEIFGLRRMKRMRERLNKPESAREHARSISSSAFILSKEGRLY